MVEQLEQNNQRVEEQLRQIKRRIGGSSPNSRLSAAGSDSMEGR